MRKHPIALVAVFAALLLAGASGASTGTPDSTEPGGGGSSTCYPGYLYGEREINAIPAVGSPAYASVRLNSASELTESGNHLTSEIWITGTYNGHPTWVEAGLFVGSNRSPEAFIAYKNDAGTFVFAYGAFVSWDTWYSVYIYPEGNGTWAIYANGHELVVSGVHENGAVTEFGGESYQTVTGACNTLSDSFSGIGPWAATSLSERSDSPYYTSNAIGHSFNAAG